jgi:putative pyruvate formate lyase activating enzyme
MPRYGEEWFERAEGALELLSRNLGDCRLCPRACGVDRRSGEIGFCGGGLLARVSSVFPHFGEEPPLVGRNGSGTIFLGGCSLKCAFCQNFNISHRLEGEEKEVSDLTRMILGVQGMGCHNVNLVTPSHFVPQLLRALTEARREGLEIPLVYNCGGYEEENVIEALDGIVEIYMPDMKFWSSESSDRYCGVPDYAEKARGALKEMHRQVGDLIIDGGIAVRGLLVRHLVMPGGTDESKRILDFLSGEISAGTYVNVMGQYRPVFRAREFDEIDRYPSREEYREVYDYACSLGLRLAC